MLSSDYARIHIVLQERTGAIAALVAGMRFVLARPAATGGVGIMMVITTVILMAMYAVLEILLPKNSAVQILLLFGVQQAYMIGRSAVRAMTYAAEVDVFQTSGMGS